MIITPVNVGYAASFLAANGIIRKTNTEETSNVLLSTESLSAKKKNVLNEYRSYTYKFTLAALNSTQKVDPSLYIENEDYFVIAKSGGKGAAGLNIEPVTSSDTGTILSKFRRQNHDPVVNVGVKTSDQRFQDFNETSAGAFDFYIERVLINTIISGNEKTNMSIATNIDFDIIEPLSMAGLIEALHVTALACGAPNYIQCKYFLKMEFIGYPDSDELSNPTVIPNSTRYFVFEFTGINVEVTETGTIYRCTGVPHNEKGFGTVSTLTTDVEAKGVTVGEILTSLLENYNLSNQESSQLEKTDGNPTSYDEYEIVFPEQNNDGVDESFRSNTNYQTNSIFSSKVNELYKSNSVYSFPDLDEAIESEQEGSYKKLNPSDPVVPFKRGASILDCIASVIRDSQYAIELVNDITKRINGAGMVDYFMVHLESEIKNYDEIQNRYIYKYRFIVVKYKIHYSRIYPRPIDTIDTKPIRANVHREYEYFFTGKNIDIERFFLEFNSLFFQAIPRNMANRPQSPAAAESIQPGNLNITKLKKSVSGVVQTILGKPSIIATPEASGASPDNHENATLPQAESYSQLSRRMHKAILENVDQITADLTINGDPYYLVTNGLGIQRFKLNQDGTAGFDEAPIYNNDVMIYIKFVNPYDIDQTTGLMKFKNSIAIWSGIFRVLEVESLFEGGEFKQVLKLIRLNSQVEDTNEEPLPVQNFLELQTDPNKQTVPLSRVAASSTRANVSDLSNEITRGLPTSGLPGELSSLIPGAGLLNFSENRQLGSIVPLTSDNISAATNSIGSLINQLSATSNQALGNLGSLLRLTNAGLTSISPSINQLGGAVDQIAKISNSIGFSNVNNNNVASTLKSLLQLPVKQLDDFEIDKVSSLKNNAAGLVSEVFSKIDTLSKTTEDAISSQLGVNTSALSGLSSNLTGKITEKISSAVSKIPDNVNLTAEIDKGLIINNIPASALSNIPPTHPKSRAPLPQIPAVEARVLQNQLNPAERLPAQQAIRARLPVASFDAPAVANKLVTINQTASKILGRTSSVESVLNTVNARIENGVPNTSNIESSVVNRYSKTAKSSPLTNLLNNGINQ